MSLAVCEVYPTDTSTFVLSHENEYGKEVLVEFDVSDPITPLMFKQYMENNNIVKCEFMLDEELQWHNELMEKFVVSATELFKIDDYLIDSYYLH